MRDTATPRPRRDRRLARGLSRERASDDDRSIDMSTAPATGGARAASDGLRRARDAILEILAEDDDDDGDDSTSSSGEDVDGSMRFASLALEDEEATEARTAPVVASTATPRGSAIDAGVAKLEARGRAMLDAAASEERRAAVDMREAREGLERAMEEARGASRDAAALERAVAERDLEIFKRDEELTRLREENARLREEASAVSSSRASAEASVSGAVEEANRRASEAEAGARAMREALKAAETKHAGERARLMDELRQSRASLASRARELDSRARTEAHGSGRLDEVGAARKEADALAKKVDVAEAVAAKLEAVVAQKAEEIFEVTQERDALRKKLKTTSETIDSLEREWLEMSRAGSSEQEALMEENEELHKIIDQLKSNEKEGFAAAEDEITALKARLHHLEHDQGPTNRSVDRNLARESITSLRAKLRELKDEIAEKNARIEDLTRTVAQKSTLEAVNSEKDSVIMALQAQINAANATTAATTRLQPLDADLDALDELQTVADALRRENADLRREIEASDAAGVLDECIALSRRVTAQRSILMSYEERLSRYTDALGIPFTPEPLP